jgi:hypothetical protein
MLTKIQKSETCHLSILVNHVPFNHGLNSLYHDYIDYPNHYPQFGVNQHWTKRSHFGAINIIYEQHQSRIIIQGNCYAETKHYSRS